MNLLITGGTGFIGSHTVVELLQAGHQTIILDNLSNSDTRILSRIQKICGKEPIFYQGDIRDKALLKQIFTRHAIDGVIHFAALKAVGESVQQPLNYYDNNLTGTLTLLQAMSDAQVFQFIFSSSATVYGNPQTVPIKETDPTGDTTNPYGTSKHFIERVLQDLHHSDPRWKIVLLRYFNPIGAHPSGLIGELPNGIPNNLLPYICQVATGKLKQLSVFGNDYPTADGTGIRDYIHVVDLARGHVLALQNQQSGIHIYNLGTGSGYSVLDIVHTFEKVSGQTIPYQICPRRNGDIAICYADANKAKNELNWVAEYQLDDMLRDAWHWHSHNPNGYQD